MTYPGFKNAIICPQAGGGITWSADSLLSIRGLLGSAWTNDLSATNCTLTLSIPAHSTASIYLPTTNLGKIFESGMAATSAVGVLSFYVTNLLNFGSGAACFKIGSGSYSFTASNTTFLVTSGP